MRRSHWKTWAAGTAACAFVFAAASRVRALPPDVRPGHWAAPAVEEALANGVMTLDTDHRFHGEAKVTRAQAAIALAKLARKLEANQWRPANSVPVPQSVVPTLQKGSWKQRPVTRYILASVLTRYGSYVSHGVTRAPAGSTDAGKSALMPPSPNVKVAKTSPAYDSLAYLAAHHELWPGSPLLKETSKPVNAVELSQAVKELVIGLNNRLTALGLDASGNTPDATFHTKKKH